MAELGSDKKSFDAVRVDSWMIDGANELGREDWRVLSSDSDTDWISNDGAPLTVEMKFEKDVTILAIALDFDHNRVEKVLLTFRVGYHDTDDLKVIRNLELVNPIGRVYRAIRPSDISEMYVMARRLQVSVSSEKSVLVKQIKVFEAEINTEFYLWSAPEALKDHEPGWPFSRTSWSQRSNIRSGLYVVRSLSKGKIAVKEGDEEILQEFLQGCRLHHRNVLQHLYYVKINGKHYTCIEMMDLMDLAETVGDLRDVECVDSNTIKCFIREVLYGLEYVHCQKIVLRDLKCSNIFIGCRGDMKVVVPNSSILEGEIVESTCFSGFMAPEVVVCKPPITTKADIWSLGCMIYEIYTGKSPFKLEDLKELDAVYLDKKDIPSDVYDIMQFCLKLNPEERPTALELLDHPFFARRGNMSMVEGGKGEAAGQAQHWYISGAKELRDAGIWSATSSAPDHGPSNLSTADLDTYWLPVGVSPHCVHIRFNRMVDLLGMQLFFGAVDYGRACKTMSISLKGGNSIHTVKKLREFEIVNPSGWYYRAICDWNDSAMHVRIAVLEISITFEINVGICQIKLFESQIGEISLPEHEDIEPGLPFSWKSWANRRELFPNAKIYSLTSVTNELIVVKKEMEEPVLMEYFESSCWDHPNIVRHLHYFKLNGSHYTSMEYARSNLKDLCRELNTDGSLGLGTVKQHIRKVLQALVYLHAHGYIHGDITCENILIFADGETKVADFNSLSKVGEALQNITSNSSCMVPELVEQRGASVKVDTWCLGCAIFEMFNNQGPFDRVHFKLPFRQLVENENHLSSLQDYLPREVYRLVRLCLVYDVEKRPSASDLLSDTFFSVNEA